MSESSRRYWSGVGQDLTGRRFGRLVAQELIPERRYGGRRVWRCQCDCGSVVEVLAGSLRSGVTRSCGCLNAERRVESGKRLGMSRLRHGRSHSAEYKAWSSIRCRCNNPNTPNYADYGGRGIKVCEEWLDSFEAFFAHVGPRPSAAHSIDRIDNERGYEPGNVRWAVMKVQQNNRRSNRSLTFNGRTLTVQQWADELGMNPGVLYDRLHAGWPDERILTEPVHPRRKADIAADKAEVAASSLAADKVASAAKASQP